MHRAVLRPDRDLRAAAGQARGRRRQTFHPELVDEFGFPTIGITPDHWFGVEPKTGRDNFARWVYGARPSLIVAFVATIFGTTVGVVMGLLAGFLGGWVDRVISWFIDFVLSLPYLLFAIAMVPIVESWRGGSFNLTPEEQASTRFYVLIFVLSFFGWAGLARIIRGEVLSLREREFVAGRQGDRCVDPADPVQGTAAEPGRPDRDLGVPRAAGVRDRGSGAVLPRRRPDRAEPVVGPDDRQRAPTGSRPTRSTCGFRSLAITILVLALALLGDAIRDAFDPKTRR